MSYSPSFGEVRPVRHDHGAQHDVILREVAVEEICGADHGNTEDVRKLVSVCRISPGGLHVTLAVVIKGVKVCGRSVLRMQVRCRNGWRHPLVIRKKRDQRFSSHLRVFPIGPVRVHELYGFPQGVLSFRIAIQVVNKFWYGKLEVVARYSILTV